jgi:hypothetical protein
VVTIISDFSLPTQRVNGAAYYGKYLIPIFFFLILFILILLANRSRLEEMYKKY